MKRVIPSHEKDRTKNAERNPENHSPPDFSRRIRLRGNPLLISEKNQITLKTTISGIPILYSFFLGIILRIIIRVIIQVVV